MLHQNTSYYCATRILYASNIIIPHGEMHIRINFINSYSLTPEWIQFTCSLAVDVALWPCTAKKSIIWTLRRRHQRVQYWKTYGVGSNRFAHVCSVSDIPALSWALAEELSSIYAVGLHVISVLEEDTRLQYVAENC